MWRTYESLIRRIWIFLSPVYTKFLNFNEKISMGDGAIYIGAPIFRGKGSVRMGAKGVLASRPYSNPLHLYRPCIFNALKGAVIQIGDNFHASGCCIIARENVIIGNNVMLGAHVTILDNDMHALSVPGKWGGISSARARKVTIGDNVWIGMNTIILKGVTIGARSIVGAGAVLRNDVPADSRVLSVPPNITSIV